MARWHGLGLWMLLAGCSLDTGPQAATFVSRGTPPTWSPSHRPATRVPSPPSAGRAAVHVDAAMPDKQDDAMRAPPTAADGKPVADAGSPDAIPIGAAADGGRTMQAPTTQQPPANGDRDGGGASANPRPNKNDPASGMNTQGKEASGGNQNGRGSHKHSDDDKAADDGKRGRDDDKRAEPNTETSSVTPVQDGGLWLLFTGVSNLVFSILQLSSDPAEPANITNPIASIVALASLPASEVTTASLTELLNQLDASNVCTDNRSACKSLCETLTASCDLYKFDPASVQSVERNCGAKSLAACK